MTATGVRVLVVTVGLPEARLFPNSSTPERTKKDLRAQQRKDAGLATRAVVGAVREPFFPAGVKVELRLRVRWDRPGRFPDTDNLTAALKGAADGLADGMAFADDKQIVRWQVLFERVAFRKGEVEFMLVEA